MSGFGGGGFGQGPYGGQPIITLGVGYYVALLTSQYQNSPNFLTRNISEDQKYEDILQCMISFQQAFDIDTAVGVQLDMLGVNAGVSRTVPFQPTGGISPVMDDATYRVVIKATLAQYTWDGLIDSLYTIWAELFPGGKLILTDNQNMTATVSLSGTFTALIQQLITNGLIVPRSETVQYTYTFATLPIFGADLNNVFIAGADLGHAS
jgi:hypothetical protein